MSIRIGVRVKQSDLRRLARDLAPANVQRALSRVVADVTLMTQTRIAVYPPQSEANRPSSVPGARWYQRLVGPRWRRKDGSIGGRKTSEQLQKNWRQELVAPLSREVFTRGDSGLEVSYVDFVVGDAQASFHAERGWPTTEEVAEEVERDPMIEVAVVRELDRELGT